MAISLGAISGAKGWWRREKDARATTRMATGNRATASTMALRRAGGCFLASLTGWESRSSALFKWDPPEDSGRVAGTAPHDAPGWLDEGIISRGMVWGLQAVFERHREAGVGKHPPPPVLLFGSV